MTADLHSESRMLFAGHESRTHGRYLCDCAFLGREDECPLTVEFDGTRYRGFGDGGATEIGTDRTAPSTVDRRPVDAI